MTLAVALVTQHIVNAWQKKQNWYCTNHRMRHFNYLAIATRWSTSVIKVSGGTHSNTFKRRLYSYRLHLQYFWLKATVKNKVLEYKANLICMHCYAFLSDESLFMWLPCDVIVSLSTVILYNRCRPENIWLLKRMHLDKQCYNMTTALITLYIHSNKPNTATFVH